MPNSKKEVLKSLKKTIHDEVRNLIPRIVVELAQAGVPNDQLASQATGIAFKIKRNLVNDLPQRLKEIAHGVVERSAIPSSGLKPSAPAVSKRRAELQGKLPSIDEGREVVWPSSDLRSVLDRVVTR